MGARKITQGCPTGLHPRCGEHKSKYGSCRFLCQVRRCLQVLRLSPNSYRALGEPLSLSEPQVCVLSRFSRVPLFATSWTVARHAPLSGILQAGILQWVAMPSPRGSSQPRDGTLASCISCMGRGDLYHQHHPGSPWTPWYHYLNGGSPSLLCWSVGRVCLQATVNLASQTQLTTCCDAIKLLGPTYFVFLLLIEIRLQRYTSHPQEK